MTLELAQAFFLVIAFFALGAATALGIVLLALKRTSTPLPTHEQALSEILNLSGTTTCGQANAFEQAQQIAQHALKENNREDRNS